MTSCDHPQACGWVYQEKELTSVRRSCTIPSSSPSSLSSPFSCPPAGPLRLHRPSYTNCSRLALCCVCCLVYTYRLELTDIICEHVFEAACELYGLRYLTYCTVCEPNIKLANVFVSLQHVNCPMQTCFVSVLVNCSVYDFLLPQVHLSDRGHMLRFLAMIWTAPAATLAPPPAGWVSVATQASSLSMFCSYLKCLSPVSVVGLASQTCPGIYIQCVCVCMFLSVHVCRCFVSPLPPSLSLSLSLPPPSLPPSLLPSLSISSSGNISADTTNKPSPTHPPASPLLHLPPPRIPLPPPSQMARPLLPLHTHFLPPRHPRTLTTLPLHRSLLPPSPPQRTIQE